MPSIVVLTDIVQPPSGKIFVRYNDGTELEFGSMAELERAISEVDSEISNTQLMALGWIHARQPDLVNIAPIQGRDFIYDLGNPNAIRVQ